MSKLKTRYSNIEFRVELKDGYMEWRGVWIGSDLAVCRIGEILDEGWAVLAFDNNVEFYPGDLCDIVDFLNQLDDDVIHCSDECAEAINEAIREAEAKDGESGKA
jgi:hypothetical protein